MILLHGVAIYSHVITSLYLRDMIIEIELDEGALAPVNEMFDGLRQLLDGISLVQEASPRVKARVMAHGELLSTMLGVSILKVVYIYIYIYIDSFLYLPSVHRNMD